MISRIGHSRGRPIAQVFGKCGAITRQSASVRSVWYRVTGAAMPLSTKGVEGVFEHSEWFDWCKYYAT